MKEFKVKVIVRGSCKGEPVVINRKISFFGEVDPEKGVVTSDGVCITDKPLVIAGTRGSTVGSYVIYALKEYGRAPSCIIAGEAEPILIIGCIIANIPLFVVEDYREFIDYLGKHKKPYIEVDDGKEVIRVYEEGILHSNRGA
ncbi:DUF126 domain-containing protein [Desulfurococcaceae archaeon MEX13E-LK6-19]|nr:DUF126 domain-containing protein [Desulfurococcaceae archaeon MEX13E-LK6-19]